MKLNVKHFRKKKGWTQQQFAEKLGMSLSYVKKIEIGLIFPSGKSMKRMSDLLECSPADLLADIAS